MIVTFFLHKAQFVIRMTRDFESVKRLLRDFEILFVNLQFIIRLTLDHRKILERRSTSYIYSTKNP